MLIRICDGCGKQISRYDDSNIVRYDVTKIRCKSHEKDESGNPLGLWSRHLEFCPDCYEKIEEGIDSVLGNESLPEKFEREYTIYRSE